MKLRHFLDLSRWSTRKGLLTFKVKNTQHNSQIKKSTEVLYLGAGFMFWKKKRFDRLNLNFKKVQWKNFQSFSDTNSNNFRLAKSHQTTSVWHLCHIALVVWIVWLKPWRLNLACWAIVPFIPSDQRSGRVRVIFQELVVPLKYISYSAASLLELRWLLPGTGKLEHKVCQTLGISYYYRC